MFFYRFYDDYSKNDIPILDIGDQVGDTQYIDFITSDMMSHYIMRGVDKFGRPFLSVKVEQKFKISKNSNDTNDEEEETDVIKQKTKSIVGTFFQRYSDGEYPTVFGTAYNRNIIYHNTTVSSLYETNTAIGRLKKLLAGEMIRDIDIWKTSDNLSYEEIEELYINGNGESFIYIPQIREQVEKEILNYLYKDVAGIVMEYF
jgi:hypothetical protein